MPKRTISNCSVIKKAIKQGIGECGIEEGKCKGYVTEGEEPCSKCIDCKLNLYYDGGEI